MATSAFRSTSKRTSIGASPTSTDVSSLSNRSSAHRRSHSLSQFSRPIPEPEIPFTDQPPTPRERFLNTFRESGHPDVRLDELAVDLFSSGYRGRSVSNNTDVNSMKSETVSQRRGRSVSTHTSRTADAAGGIVVERGSSVRNAAVRGTQNSSRRRRSVSVVAYPASDSESDLDVHNASRYTKRNSQKTLSGKKIATNQSQSLRRLSSHRDLKSYDDVSGDLDMSHHTSTRAKMKSFSNGDSKNASLAKSNTANQSQLIRKCSSQMDLKSYDCNSSQSSSLTDDEIKDGYSTKIGMERVIRAVYSQKKADHPVSDDVNSVVYEAMRKDLRPAVEEIKMEIGQDRFLDTAPLKSEDPLSAKVAEVVDIDSSLRKNHEMKVDQRKTNVKKMMSNRMSEDAELYIDEFISNIEDTDISSIDGERSDTSSSLGVVGVVKLLDTCYETTPVPVTPKRVALPLEVDGVVLPWLQWEIIDDIITQPSKQEKVKIESTPPTNAHEEESNNERGDTQGYSYFMSNRQGSCIAGTCPATGRWSMDFVESKVSTKLKSPPSLSSSNRRIIDLYDYMNVGMSEEDFIFERWSQHQRISPGGLLLCNHMTFF